MYTYVYMLNLIMSNLDNQIPMFITDRRGHIVHHRHKIILLQDDALRIEKCWRHVPEVGQHDDRRPHWQNH